MNIRIKWASAVTGSQACLRCTWEFSRVGSSPTSPTSMIELRNFSLTDLDQIMKIEKISFPDRKAYSRSYFETLYRNYPQGFIIAEAENKVIGYTICRSRNGFAEIISLAVDPDWREKGIGTKLINFLINHFKERGFKKIILHVRTENKKAIVFYQSLGFKILNIIENYYSNGKDSYLMKKEIMGG